MKEAEDRVAAITRLKQDLLDQGDEQPWEEQFDLRTVGVRLFVAPKDPGADYHMRWDGAEWHLEEGPVPLPPGPRHWWRAVMILAAHYGVRLPMTVPEKAVKMFDEGMSSYWYARHHLEADMGVAEDERAIPTLEQIVKARKHCELHHEPLVDDECPAAVHV
jgi:hypothetical protein